MANTSFEWIHFGICVINNQDFQTHSFQAFCANQITYIHKGIYRHRGLFFSGYINCINDEYHGCIITLFQVYASWFVGSFAVETELKTAVDLFESIWFSEEWNWGNGEYWKLWEGFWVWIFWRNDKRDKHCGIFGRMFWRNLCIIILPFETHISVS